MEAKRKADEEERAMNRLAAEVVQDVTQFVVEAALQACISCGPLHEAQSHPCQVKPTAAKSQAHRSRPIPTRTPGARANVGFLPLEA